MSSPCPCRTGFSVSRRPSSGADHDVSLRFLRKLCRPSPAASVPLFEPNYIRLILTNGEHRHIHRGTFNSPTFTPEAS
jgi:hypothetical protein